VSKVSELNALPNGVLGLVWLGLCNGANSTFIGAVQPFIGNSKLWGFYLMDEPNPFANGAAYCASKAGLNAFSEALMQELRYDNIRVSYVLPGSVSTAFSSGEEGKGADWKIAPAEVADVVVNLLRHNPRSLPSRVELRPSKPRK